MASTNGVLGGFPCLLISCDQNSLVCLANSFLIYLQIFDTLPLS
jgi:hypothetical protein